MRVFLAGGTGATGQVFAPMATDAGVDLIFHVRPASATKTPLAQDSRTKIFDLADADACAVAMAGCDAVLSFVGTMRNRFARGDTYESSDLATTRQLTQAAITAGVRRFLLLSSVGAGGLGAYLKMKRECEEIVERSSLAWTIFRPSILISPEGAPVGTHGSRKAPYGSRAFFEAAQRVPALSRWAEKMRPIPIVTLCRAFLHVLMEPRDGAIFEGHEIRALAGEPS